MNNDKLKFWLCLLFFSILAAVAFRCTWEQGYVFSASDLNIGRLAFIKRHLPESFIGYFTGNQLFGSTGAGFSLFNVLLAVQPLMFFANSFYGMVLVAGSLSMVWYLRMWNRSWLASVVGALIAFWVNSVMLPAAGHAYKMEVLALSVLALGLIEKAVRAESIRKSLGFAILAGLSVGIMMIEQQDVALLAGLFIGSYAVFRLVQVHGRAVLSWLTVLLPVGVVALLLSGSTIAKSYEHNISEATTTQDNGEEHWNFITQWSLVPAEWPDLVASGWAGWASNDPQGPYWGKLGQSAEWSKTGQGFQNFRIAGNYIGIIPFLLGGFGLMMAIRNRKNAEGKLHLFWSIAGLVGIGLAFGKYSILYKLFYHLPLVGNIRAPIKLLDNFQICLGIVSAYGLDRLLTDERKKRSTKIFWIAGSAIGGLMLLAGLKVLAFPDAWTTEFSRLGYEPFTETMLKNMSLAWIHGGLLALILAALVYLVWKGWRQTKWVAAIFSLVLAIDSLILTSHYFRASDISALDKGNVVVDYIRDNQGDERTYFIDTGGIYTQWLASDGPYRGLNLFNIWQMSRMPADYTEFLGTVERNQIRLWELASIKYVAAPASILQQLSQNPELGKRFEPVLNYQVPTAQGMRQDVLLEFNSAIPRFALFQGWKSVPLAEQCQTLASPSYNVHSTVLLDPAANLGHQSGATDFLFLKADVTKCSATVSVECDVQSIVRFSQYFQPEWTVYVDGEPAELLRVDYLCMGVSVPPGEHVVEFRCASGVRQAAFALGVFVVSAIAATLLLLRSVRKDAE
ncbi:MAG: hypothetical protein GXY61_02495 [Lentisphaerae bacterium]|nr:hypothetical protein [Lentisphaerota bacterium]